MARPSLGVDLCEEEFISIGFGRALAPSFTVVRFTTKILFRVVLAVRSTSTSIREEKIKAVIDQQVMQEVSSSFHKRTRTNATDEENKH